MFYEGIRKTKTVLFLCIVFSGTDLEQVPSTKARCMSNLAKQRPGNIEDPKGRLARFSALQRELFEFSNFYI